MVVTLGEQYNIGEKPTVILYTYINHHTESSSITKQKTLYCVLSFVLDVSDGLAW